MVRVLQMEINIISMSRRTPAALQKVGAGEPVTASFVKRTINTLSSLGHGTEKAEIE